jgi:uridine kinase
MVDFEVVLRHITDARHSVDPRQAVLAAVTGIDGCGKGYVTNRIVDAILAQGFRATAINIDGWLNLPQKRFDPSRPADHFYHHAIRFDEMFSQLVFPLRNHRSVRVEADYAEETATEYRRCIYEFQNIDVILLEGIYLLKRAFQSYYDLSVWIDCTFETALERAIIRAQEGLSRGETVRAYRTVYFPAQEIHSKQDNPMVAATLILNNDARLGPVAVG